MEKKKYTPELFSFAFFPRYEDSISYLANNLADKEAWDFSDSLDKSYSISLNPQLFFQ
jgi:hypothetical protein